MIWKMIRNTHKTKFHSDCNINLITKIHLKWSEEVILQHQPSSYHILCTFCKQKQNTRKKNCLQQHTHAAHSFYSKQNPFLKIKTQTKLFFLCRWERSMRWYSSTSNSFGFVSNLNFTSVFLGRRLVAQNLCLEIFLFGAISTFYLVIRTQWGNMFHIYQQLTKKMERKKKGNYVL